MGYHHLGAALTFVLGYLDLWSPASYHGSCASIPFMSKFLAGSIQDTMVPNILKNTVSGRCLDLGLAAGIGDRRSGGLHPLCHHSGIGKSCFLEDQLFIL